MFFAASKLFWLIGAPSHVLLILTTAAAILLNTKFERPGRRLAIASGVLFVVIGVLPTGTWLAGPLEDRFSRSALPSHIDGVLVLGGGLHTKIVESRDAPAMESSEARLVSAFELARLYPNARVVFSGGSGDIGAPGASEARAAKRIFGQMGLNPMRLTLEDKSRNTWENFLFSQKMVKPQSGEIWVLATSAIQLPRAMRVAERAHWKMIPWPTDYMTPRSRLVFDTNISENLAIVDGAVHEWIGLIAYRFK